MAAAAATRRGAAAVAAASSMSSECPCKAVCQSSRQSTLCETRGRQWLMSLRVVHPLYRGENFYRDAKQARRVKLLAKDGIASKAIRDKDGNVIQAAEFQSSEATPGRVQPDRRWFGECLSGRRRRIVEALVGTQVADSGDCLSRSLALSLPVHRQHACHLARCPRPFPHISQLAR